TAAGSRRLFVIARVFAPHRRRVFRWTRRRRFGWSSASAGKATQACTSGPVEESTMADVVDLIEQDHRAAERLFGQFEASNDAAIADQICEELTKHTRAEERAVYPVLRDRLSDGRN